MAHTSCLVGLILLLVATAKKAKNVALVAGTQQNLSNLEFSLDIYGEKHSTSVFKNDMFFLLV